MSGAIPQPLFARTFGQGARQVLALHCTMAHSGAWRGLGEAMGDTVTITATDMLCHGKSPDWDGDGDFQDRMTEAAGAHLKPGMDVIGHSFGATVALRLAVAFPHMVRSLTMIEAVMFSVLREDRPDLVEREVQDSAPFRAAVESGDLVNAARIFNRGWGDERGPKWADLPEARRAAMARGVRIVPACSPAVIYDRPGMLRPGGLDGLEMPVLLLRGGNTHATIGEINDGLARRIRHATNTVVPGAGHMLPISHPVETAAEIRAHLARCS